MSRILIPLVPFALAALAPLFAALMADAASTHGRNSAEPGPAFVQAPAVRHAHDPGYRPALPG